MTTDATRTRTLPHLEGLITDECASRLMQLASEVTEGVIVEIGAFKGKSSCALGLGASTSTKVYSIDPWDLHGNIYGKHGFTDPAVLETWRRQIEMCGLTGKVTPIREFSYNVAPRWAEPIGMLFIDGGHTYREVRRDWESFSRHVLPGATVVFDDYVGRNHGVRQAVDELINLGLLTDLDLSQPPFAITRKKAVRDASTIKLSVAIMAHPKRARYMEYLQSRMQQRATIVWDQKNDRWDTGRRSQLAYSADATHHLVVQDDAILPRSGFLEAVEESLRYVPDNPISFYTGMVRPSAALVTSKVNQVKAAGLTWFMMQGPWWGVAVCTPTKLIPDMIKWGDMHPHIANYDLRMSKYYDTKRIRCYYSIPSLVSHRVGPEDPSLVPGRGSGRSRVAHEFIGEDADARTVKWTQDAVVA